MINVLERARNKNFPAIRLLQSSYHNRSLALYAGLGFEVREPISTMQGKPIREVLEDLCEQQLSLMFSHAMLSAKQFMVMTEMAN